MSVLFNFVSSMLDAESDGAKSLEATLTEQGNTEYFGWQKLTRQIDFPGGRNVNQVYFAGFEKNSLNFPEQLHTAYLKALDSEAEIIWFSDEGDKGIFTNDENREF